MYTQPKFTDDELNKIQNNIDSDNRYLNFSGNSVAIDPDGVKIEMMLLKLSKTIILLLCGFIFPMYLHILIHKISLLLLSFY